MQQILMTITKENIKGCNRWNMVCRDTQRCHIYFVIEEEDSDKIWNFLKSIGVGQTQNNINPHNIDLNLLNQHFSLSGTIDSAKKVTTINHLSAPPTLDIPHFESSQFSVSGVKRNILPIKSNAVGTDCISHKIIVSVLDY